MSGDVAVRKETNKREPTSPISEDICCDKSLLYYVDLLLSILPLVCILENYLTGDIVDRCVE